MLFNIRLESLLDRYSAIWNQHIPDALRAADVRYITINGPDYDRIETGEFLDVLGTCAFKTSQTETIVELFKQKRVKDGDVFFFHDLWHPALTTLLYIRDALGIRLKITGFLHAGSYCEGDMLNRTMRSWALAVESGWFNNVDLIIVATKYHRKMVEEHFGDAYVKDLWFPMWFDGVSPSPKKENIVVFPHRLTPERCPAIFDEVTRVLTEKYDYLFIKTHDVTKTRKEYLEVLGRAKYIVSTSSQETWGIAMQEGVVAGCWPIAPYACSYPEYLPIRSLYPRGDPSTIATKLAEAIDTKSNEDATLVKLAEHLVLSGKHAMGHIVRQWRDMGWNI